MTSLDDALRTILDRTPEIAPVATPLADAYGRVLREPVTAPHDMPRTDRATMDGYAVHFGESGPWRVVRVAPTNDTGVCDFAEGEAVRVSTGTTLVCARPVRVLPQESVVREGDTIRCENPPANRFVHRRGSDAKAK